MDSMTAENLKSDNRKSGRVIWLTLLSIIIWIVLVRIGKEKALFSELTLASGIYFLCILPTLIYFKHKEKTLPYAPILGIIYFIYYAYPVFTNYETFYIYNLEPTQINKALTLALLGILFFLLAFYSPLGAITKALPRIKIYWDHSKAFILAIILSLIGISMQYIILSNLSKIPLSLQGVCTFITKLPIVSILILYLLQLQRKLSLKWKFFLWLFLIPVRFILLLTTGSTLPFILEIIILVLLYIQQRQRVPWQGIIIGSLIILFVFSVRDEYRFLISYEGSLKYSTTPKKALLYLQLLQKHVFGPEKEITPTYEKLALRTNNAVLFSRIVSLTPDYIPYWNGYTYKTLLTSLLPRFIAPDKPTKTLGQEFGHRYSLLHPSDYTTSYNLPQLIEMYINFGPLGVIVGMFLMGLLYRSIYTCLNHPDAGEGGLIICLTIFDAFLNIESYFLLVFGSILQYIMFFYIVIRITRLKNKGHLESVS